MPAPDMYAALKEHAEIHFQIIDALKRIVGTENLRTELYKLLDCRRAAIAKAEGGK